MDDIIWYPRARVLLTRYLHTMLRLPRGALIVIEGIDGTGKSTLARALAARLAALGLEVVSSREPTDGPDGARIRAAAAAGRRLPAEEELSLFLSDRRAHVEQRIAPALERGAVVVLDRYYFSTAAYQGARGAGGFDELIAANEAFAPPPDLLLLVALDPAIALGRIDARGEGQTAFERAEALAGPARLFASLERPYLRRLDGDRSPEAVEAEAWGACRELLGQRLGCAADEASLVAALRG